MTPEQKAYSAGYEAARKQAADFCRNHEVGVTPSKGYVISKTFLEGTQGTHPGMAYARAIATMTPEKADD